MPPVTYCLHDERLLNKTASRDHQFGVLYSMELSIEKGTKFFPRKIRGRAPITSRGNSKCGKRRRFEPQKNSDTGTRTRVSCVRGKYDNHLHYIGLIRGQNFLYTYLLKCWSHSHKKEELVGTSMLIGPIMSQLAHCPGPCSAFKKNSNCPLYVPTTHNRLLEKLSATTILN
jgi:hypothetical protein